MLQRAFALFLAVTAIKMISAASVPLLPSAIAAAHAEPPAASDATSRHLEERAAHIKFARF